MGRLLTGADASPWLAGADIRPAPGPRAATRVRALSMPAAGTCPDPSTCLHASNTDSDPAHATVTEIVTHVTQHDAIGRNMALLRPCTFENALSPRDASKR